MGVEALCQAVCDLSLAFGEGNDGDKKKVRECHRHTRTLACKKEYATSFL